MRVIALAKRNTKEILRDKISLVFLMGFPLALIFLLSAIQANIPVALYEIQHLVPGITVFGLSFVTLFSATLISKDRESSLLRRLYTAPIKPFDFILGYTLPMIPISIGQAIICYAAAFVLGLGFSLNVLWAIIFIFPVSLLYIAMGLLFGSILNDKQVGGVCGALLTNLSAWVSGIWFDLDLVGGIFKKICYFLPFVHAVEMGRKIIVGNYTDTLPHLLWVVGYSIIIFSIAIVLFLRQMKKK